MYNQQNGGRNNYPPRNMWPEFLAEMQQHENEPERYSHTELYAV